jgi:hypothetical protein
MGEGKKHEGPAMYDVRGNDALNVKAIQVYPVSLNIFIDIYIYILFDKFYLI